MPYPSIPRGPGGSPLPVRWNSTAGNWEVLEGAFVDSNLNEAELKQADDGSYLLGTAGYGTTGSGVLIPRKVTDDGYDIMRQTASNVTDEMIQLLNDIHSEIAMSDISNPNTLSYGNMDAGFFGIIPAEDFITGDALCAELGITQGSSQFSNTPWLKFAFKDKIIITPMKPIRYGISWDHIYEAGAVYGDGLTAGESGAEHHNLTSSSGTDLTPTKQDANVDVNGLNYKVRLMRGAADDPTNSFSDSDRGSRGPENEWNALMLPIHERAVSSSWRFPECAPTSVANWGINFSDGDLITHRNFGNGSYRWMQETRDDDVSQRVYRGNSGVSFLYAGGSANTHSSRGFGPALVRG